MKFPLHPRPFPLQTGRATLVALAFGLLVCLLWRVSALAQADASLFLDGTERATIAYALRPDGPRFDPLPIAAALGISVQVGPLGDSHVVLLEQKKVVFGPNNTTLVIVALESARTGSREQVVQLKSAPIKDATGIKVPIELLERVFGEEKNVEIRWDEAKGRLDLSFRKGNALQGEIQVVHQYRVSTVEIGLSTKPRFKVERSESTLDIVFIGDTFQLRQPLTLQNDPLVEQVQVASQRIRLILRKDAAAAEPRLLEGTAPSLLIDVYQRVETAPVERSGTGATPFATGPRTIVLDPGHGGSETGALGAHGTVEAQLTLQVARLLKTRLEQRLPLKVVLTRNDDVNVELDRRVAIANQNKAELFISLHFNSYRGTRAAGAETYFLSRAASDQLAAKFAENENQSGAPADAPGAGLDLILWDLAQSHHLAQSQRFAEIVQQELNTTLGLTDRGVRQAPFRVLMGATMPAVLVELGFISNPEEAAKLQDPLYLDELVDAMVRAISRFRAQKNSAGEPAATEAAGVAQ